MTENRSAFAGTERLGGATTGVATLERELVREDVVGATLESPDVSLAVLDHRLQVLDANLELFRLLDRRPAQVFRHAFPDLVCPQVAGPLRTRLSWLADGREKRFRGSFTGLVPSVPGLPVTVVANVLRGPGAAMVLMITPDSGPVVVPTARSGSDNQLSEIEVEILQGIARGASSTELATELYLSRQGVDYHVLRLQRKFKAKNRPELISRAYASGILDPQNWPPKFCRPSA
jgi:DNA-binding CsgD family transcriptional regulator